ncbi:MAG: tetratricopeptide repeat protein [Rhodospirillaceae bacterium]|jgi:Tfp pilus assembly protein PilF|nr:tetratricopeptide repeat protein [Rhodospirillaceae bacterium]MBT3926083.1 tetratricopeptide repeat protein [Rhodospirillaceae bacterium]MBT4428441.1 tetratricopeptide repeat protein [Rhodospirillaceae bacterium]MBT5038280.1 tetratricopeptide repeat protein [Rhodospirillaceae bacterium]MBT5677018.1 tetratricopeptide repeat protein [Rhodospirillaceae bacterium]
MSEANALWARASELARTGEIRQAEKILTKLARIAPDNADIYGFHGTLKVQSGKHAQAVPLLKRALRLDDGNPTTHGSLAVAYEGLSKSDKAKTHYLRALELDPKQARTHMNLGSLYWQEGKRENAITHYEQAIDLDEEFAEAYVYLGQAMHFLGRIDDALRCGETAVRLEPSSATGHLNFGRTLLANGRIEEAIFHFREAITLNGRLAEAYENYAYSRRVDAGDTFSDDLHAALAERGWSDGERARLLYAAGKVADDRGNHDAAMTHWIEGARLRRKSTKFNIAASRKQFAGYQAVFDTTLFESRLHRPVEGPTPIFVVGMPRSGTTLAEQILASHPLVTGLGELPHIADIALGVTEWSDAGGKFPSALLGLDDSDWARAAKLYMARLGRAGDEPYISDKMPGNFHYLGFISLLFPNARIVHCRRDALDVCVSCFTTDFTEGQEWSYELGELGICYGLYEELMAHWKRVLPLPIYDIQYEAVVADLAGEARRLLDFCGLDWHPDCLEFHRSERPVFTASSAQVRQPIYASSVGRWRHYEDQLKPLIDNLPPEAIA